jgi:hypothetical protein
MEYTTLSNTQNLMPEDGTSFSDYMVLWFNRRKMNQVLLYSIQEINLKVELKQTDQPQNGSSLAVWLQQIHLNAVKQSSFMCLV